MTKSTGKLFPPPRSYTPQQVLDFYTIPEALTGCHLCWACRNRAGYPTIQAHGVRWRANRLAWTLANGAIPLGKVVRHRCDNPGCVNLDHLVLGSDADNVADKVARDRQAKGARNGNSKITEAVAAAIFAATGSGKDIAARFGVSASLVCLIKGRRIWTHIHLTAGGGVSP